MKISGLQKVTLLDYPGKVAATVFTPGCNLRCPFCHNASLVLQTGGEDIPPEKVLSFLKKRQGILDGVCVSGGEPLLQPDLSDFLGRIRALGFAVKLDTNGTNPTLLDRLIREGLVDYVAMDIKNSRERYGHTVGIPDFDCSAVEASVNLLLRGTVDYEFRTTVVRGLHDAQSFSSIADWIVGAKRYFLQNFVDSGDLISRCEGCSRQEMEEFLRLLSGRMAHVELRGI